MGSDLNIISLLNKEKGVCWEMNQEDVSELETVKQMRPDEDFEEGISHEQTISQEADEAELSLTDDDRLTDVGMLPVKPFREQDIFLPIANVARIMKNSIPPNGKIAKEAKECVQECVSEFISFITSEAAERCQQEKRKTINGEDILFALSTLGFDPYVEPLKLYLTKYRESIKGDKTLSEDLGEDGSIQIQQQMAVQLGDGTAQHVLIQGEGIQQMADGQFILKSDRFE